MPDLLRPGTGAAASTTYLLSEEECAFVNADRGTARDSRGPSYEWPLAIDPCRNDG